MKRLFLVLSVIMMTASVATLQAQTQNEQKKEVAKENQIERLTEELGLSKNQVKDLTKINDTYKAERERNIEAMKAAKRARLESFVKLLNDEQMVKYLEMQNKRGKQGVRGKQGKRGKQGNAKMGRRGQEGNPQPVIRKRIVKKETTPVNE